MEMSQEIQPQFLEGTNGIGILVLHGFTGSPHSMGLVTRELHELGYTVNMPLLKGHGTTPEDMETTGYKDWLNSVKTAYDTIRPLVEKLFVFGLSMGGTLTLYCTLNFKVDGAIVVNALVNNAKSFEELYNNPSTPRFIPGIGSDIKREGIVEWAYDRTPKKCIGEMLSLANLVKSDITRITVPTLIFKSLKDHVVPPDNSDFIYENISSPEKELVSLHNSYHVATLDNDLDMIIEITDNFIKKRV